MEKNGKDVKFRTKVEAGTYIRKLVHDLGKELGTGAHMKYHKRTKTGKFELEESYTPEEIQEAYKKWKNGNEKPLRNILVPVEQALDIKKVVIKDKSMARIRHGGRVHTFAYPLRTLNGKQKDILRDPGC